VNIRVDQRKCRDIYFQCGRPLLVVQTLGVVDETGGSRTEILLQIITFLGFYASEWYKGCVCSSMIGERAHKLGLCVSSLLV